MVVPAYYYRDRGCLWKHHLNSDERGWDRPRSNTCHARGGSQRYNLVCMRAMPHQNLQVRQRCTARAHAVAELTTTLEHSQEWIPLPWSWLCTVRFYK